MDILHKPITNIAAVIEHYTKKDGVDISYVCTTSTEFNDFVMDIFFRETPHPVFGNRYFGIFFDPDTRLTENQGIFITGADWVEDLDFALIKTANGYVYSRSRWDYVSFVSGFIDGGRSYVRLGGDAIGKVEHFKVRNGKMEPK